MNNGKRKNICDYCLKEIKEKDYINAVLFGKTLNNKTTPKFHKKCYEKWKNGEEVEIKEEKISRFKIMDV